MWQPVGESEKLCNNLRLSAMSVPKAVHLAFNSIPHALR
jgi:hypothetical protein